MALPNVFDNYTRTRPAPGATEPTVIELPVAASQTIKYGDILSLSSGKAQQAIAAPAAGSATLSGGNLPICGVAMASITTDASGNETAGGQTRTTVPVAIFDDRLNVLLRFAAIASNGAVGSLAFGGTIGLASEVQDTTLGTSYQFGRYTNASGASWYFLSSVTTNGEFKLLELTRDFQGQTTVEFPTVWAKAALSSTVRQLA